MPEYCYSNDEESFSGRYPTRKDALEAAQDAYFDEENTPTLFTAEVVEFDLESACRQAMPTSMFFDSLGEEAFEHAAEAAMDWPTNNVAIENAFEEAMAKAAAAFLKEHMPPQFYGVQNVKTHHPGESCD